MRLRNALALATLTTAAAVPVAHALAPAPHVAAPPACGVESTSDFPLATRIKGGPVEYAAGGEFLTWSLDLTNTTDQPCGGIHPVLVLTDRARSLRPAQIRAEFYDAGARRWRPVAFEGTDQAESVGVFGGGGTAQDGPSPSAPAAGHAFAGFAVPPRRTLTVPVRLAFSADTAPDEVVVNAAVVQRRGEDGDWVGESGDYIVNVGPARPDEEQPRDPAAPARPVPPGTAPVPARPELAHTGRETALRLAPASAALLGTGVALLLFARRTARTHGPGLAGRA